MRDFLGGRGINSKILFDELRPRVDPLGPENLLVFGTGPLAGTLTPSSRWTVTAKSPMTGGHGDAHAGGNWASELKFAGYDHVIVQGRAKKPVYISIDDNDVQLNDASDIWGEDTWKTQQMIREELREPALQIACIGQAGEKLVRFANIMHELKRAAGRGGMGAVMGSKRLKAIAVLGTGSVEVADPREFGKAVEEFDSRLLGHPLYRGISKYGTPTLTGLFNVGGRLPVRNYQYTTMEDIEEISAETFVEKYAKKSLACLGCLVHCSHYYEVKEGPYAGTHGDGPEYGCIGAVGPSCGINYMPAILKMNNLANQYGLDATSLGHTISTAMEWYQRGIITKKDTDGVALEWGNHEAAIEMIEKIARRNGFGDILAEGALRAARRIGRQAVNYVQHCLGLELHSDVRAFKGFALHFSTSTRGADHLRGFPVHIEQVPPPKELLEAMTDDENVARKLRDRHSYEYKEISVSWCQNVNAVLDSLPLCNFMHTILHTLPREMARLLSAATGIEVSSAELVRTGERIYNVERFFNVREGFGKKDDVLPERMFEPVKDGPEKGSFIDRTKFEEMLNRYYELRGWDPKTGVPTSGKLKALGIEDVAGNLRRGKKKRGLSRRT
jgi:aldehyde:ferredoxin oxidoreductase